MSIALLAPLGLFALAALALPILIHLVRRIELHATEFAALRWLSARVPPRRRIRVERPWLLLLRLLIVASLAVLLARPAVEAIATSVQPSVLVAPGVDRAAARSAIGADAAHARWLAPGFPPLDQPTPAGVAASASLLREVDASLPDGAHLRVVVPRELGGLDGERPRLAHALEWLVVEGRSPSGTASAPAPIRFAVRRAAADTAAAGWLRAAVQAWNTREPGRYVLDEAALDVPLAVDTYWLAWLAADVPPTITNWIEAGGTALLVQRPDAGGDVLWRDAGGDVLARVEASARGRIVALPSALAPETLPWLLDADFPAHLLAAMRDPAPPPDRASAEVARPGVAADGVAGARVDAYSAARPLDAWLALLAAALFVIERLVATARDTERDA